MKPKANLDWQIMRKNTNMRKKTRVLKKRTVVLKKRTVGIDKLIELLYEYPNKEFSIREISKKIGLSKSAVEMRLKKLKRESLLAEGNNPHQSDIYKIKKIN